MNEIVRELAIGLIGSLLGAATLAAISYGWKFSRNTFTESKQALNAEIARFNASNDLGKQMISQDYLFDALKWFFLGNILSTIGSVLLGFGLGSNGLTLLVSLGLFFVVALSFIVALSRIVRFNKIKRLARISPSIAKL